MYVGPNFWRRSLIEGGLRMRRVGERDRMVGMRMKVN